MDWKNGEMDPNTHYKKFEGGFIRVSFIYTNHQCTINAYLQIRKYATISWAYSEDR